MFTGIVQELGTVDNVRKVRGALRLTVASQETLIRAAPGDSVAVNGVCLTVVGKKRGFLSFDAVEETVRRTTVGELKGGDRVNLEASVKAGAVLGGHFVLGHVDCVGRVIDVRRHADGVSMAVDFPKAFASLVVHKGSIALDGVSLTVGEIGAYVARLYLIPHTMKTTTLGFRKTGDRVNIEFDIVGKYVVNFKGTEAYPEITEDFLKSKGFV